MAIKLLCSYEAAVRSCRCFFFFFKLPIQMMVLCWVSNGIMLMVDHGMVSNG